MVMMPQTLKIVLPGVGERVLSYVPCTGFTQGGCCRGGRYANAAGDSIEFTAGKLVVELHDDGKDDGKVLDLTQPLIIVGVPS